MNRMLACSALLVAPLLFWLAGCGGGQMEAPRTTTTVAAAPGAPTTTSPTAEADDDDAAPLLAWAEASPEDGSAPLTVEFEADVEGGTPPLKFSWQFGDGTPDSSEANPKHTYDRPGKYRADLSVADSAEDSDSDYIEIEVR